MTMIQDSDEALHEWALQTGHTEDDYYVTALYFLGVLTYNIYRKDTLSMVGSVDEDGNVVEF